MNERVIHIENYKYKLNFNRPLIRYEGNPVLTPEMVNNSWEEPQLKVIAVYNAGVTKYRDKIIMLFRAQLRNGISVIGKAISENGLNDWQINPYPVLKPCDGQDKYAPVCDVNQQIEMEDGGIEDPRISHIGSKYFITYSAYHGVVRDRVRVCLASTEDFESFVRYGPVLEQDMRNVVIFPERINGSFYALMRPNDDPSTGHKGGIFKEIRLARSGSVEENNWKVDEFPIMRQSGRPSSFQDKIGPGAQPLLSKHGWINIFHGVRSTMDGNPYVLGVALHDKENPSKVKVSSIPVLFPSAADCRLKEDEYIHVPNVVFTCGALLDKDGIIRVYYGGNDTVMNVAYTHEDILAGLCNEYPQEALSGKPLYKI